MGQGRIVEKTMSLFFFVIVNGVWVYSWKNKSLAQGIRANRPVYEVSK